MNDELARLDAVGHAELVRTRAASPLELVDAAIARIERDDARLNAVPIRCFEEARAAAQRELPSGPFRGVPFLLKDLGATQAGLPYSAGNRALRNAGYRSPEDNTLGARFRAAGLVVLGRTNTPEFGLQSITQPRAYGPTNNPWDLARTPGGSSGGAAAAVAAGLVPAAHGNDGAGSLRIPAAWCGVMGLKPSRGRIPIERQWISRYAAGFVLTRSVRDVAAFLDALHGPEPGDLFRVPPPDRRFSRELGRLPGQLRIALVSELPGVRLHPDARAALEHAATLLESLGHRVEAGAPPALAEEERRLQTFVMGPVEYRLCLRALSEMLGRTATREDVEPYLWELAEFSGAPISAEELVRASEWEQGWVARVTAWWAHAGFDLLLSPTVCEPPPTTASFAALADQPWELLARMVPHMAFTEPFNTTGQPAISLPLFRNAAGLPLGSQLVARFGREDLLLRVAAQLEGAGAFA
jgi:amidase